MSQTRARKPSFRDRAEAAKARLQRWTSRSDLEGGLDEEMEHEVDEDPDPELWQEDCYGCLASASLVRAREKALSTYNKDDADEAARQYDSYFNFSTLLLGFEGFILSDYLKNDPSNPGYFSDKLSWAVFIIMLSFIVNVFISVITLHMSKTTSAHTYEPWHRSFMPLCQWGCRFSVALFAIGINLLVSEGAGLRDGYKIAIHTTTGAGFLYVCCIYLSVWFGPTDRVIDHCVPRNACGDCCCSWLTGQTPSELDLLAIHAAQIRPQVEREMKVEKARIKRWREKKKGMIQELKDGGHVAMATIRRGQISPFMHDQDDDQLMHLSETTESAQRMQSSAGGAEEPAHVEDIEQGGGE